MPLLLARMVITLVFFSSSSSFLYVYSWDRLSSSSSCSFSRRHLCFRNVSLFLPFSLLVSLLLLGRYKFEWFFIFYFYFFSLRLASLPTRSRHISSKEEYMSCHVSGISASSPGCMVWRCRVRGGTRTSFSSSVLHPNVCQRPRILFRFSCSFFFLTSFFFFFLFFFTYYASFWINCFFFYLVNPRSLPLETIPFRSKKRERIGWRSSRGSSQNSDR